MKSVCSTGSSEEMTLMAALTTMSKIASVWASLLEGRSSLYPPLPGKTVNPLWETEHERRRKILETFCLFFFSSVDYEAALQRAKGKDTNETKRLTLIFMKDAALHAGIISSFSLKERQTRYNQIKRLYKLLHTGKTLTRKQCNMFSTILIELGDISQTRNSMMMNLTNRVITGRSVLPNPDSQKNYPPKHL